MEPDDGPGLAHDSPTRSRPVAGDGLARLEASARGWHRIQLAVLGFIGLCGVLWSAGDPAGPRSLQWLAAALTVVSLALAGAAVFIVGRVAFPFYGAAVEGQPDAAAIASASRRLRTGIAATYLAVAVLAVAALSGWWPDARTDGSVEVVDAQGRVWCGELVAGPAGAIALATTDRPVALPVNGVVTVRPVAACGS